MIRNLPISAHVPTAAGAQAADRLAGTTVPAHASRKQIFPNSCGAASLLCIAKELGVEKMPAYKGSLSELGDGTLELSNACEQDLFMITSGMTTHRRHADRIHDAGYSMPQHLVFAGQLLGLEMDIHEHPGIFSKVLNWLYSDVKSSLAPGTVVRPHAAELREGEAELKALAVSFAKVPVGLHWVAHRADGSYMDPGTGKNAGSFDDMQRNMRAESHSFMGYADTGISIVVRRGESISRP
ncbi:MULTISPECIES: hypothetical protein [Burkholderia]|uniref:hypothetical protein n=1 Tax=Burkholderia TaxID=32008 RepID=UPI000530CD05|nr:MULTISPECIES: hypothetical protein [Burkholderia]KGS02397.1 putative ipaJ [Burkholderia sp. ABCPW 111]